MTAWADVRGWRDLYGTLLRVAIAGQIQYRAAGAIWMIGSVLEPLVFLSVWSAVAAARGESLLGLDARGFAGYYIAMLVVNHFTFSWIMHVFEYRIQQGALAFELLRPLHPLHADLADNLAYKLVMLAIVLPTAALLAWTFEPRFTASALHWLLFPLALVLALAVRILLEWTLALAAFWTTRSEAVNQIYFTLLVFLSGRAVPVDLLPGPAAGLAHALPFYWMLGFPVELVLGRLDSASILRGLLFQALWAGLAWSGMRLVWGIALRRFAAVGG